MGKIIKKDILTNGFTYRFDDGSLEHFYPNVLLPGYKGNKGSRIEQALFGGYKVIRKDGRIEKMKI